ncbi:hypothetical protein [Streptomyces sp. AgN23]|uniref:heavy-metal-associated domain-containing protein n=1 Tax=Streptomyces sp. AgN23 TaxID=1188315 RepID=UPI001FF39CA7|nr:hypothetical protein [Streptomyces sp. AgN23]
MLPITVFTGLVSAPSRGMSGLRLRLADIADALRDTGDRRTSRRVWARAGRAHVEVHGLTGHGDGHERLARAVEEALRRVAGVNWAGVNAALGQVLVDFDEDQLGAEDVLKVVECVEAAQGTDVDSFPAGRPQPPFASAPATLAATALAADCLGLVAATIRRVSMVPALSPALRIPMAMAEIQPRVRGLLESRLGRAQADTLIGVSNAVVHALTRGEAPLALDALQRMLQLAEIRGRQVVWQSREPELVTDGDGLPERSHPPAPGPLPCRTGRWRPASTAPPWARCPVPAGCWRGPATPSRPPRRCWPPCRRRPPWGGRRSPPGWAMCWRAMVWCPWTAPRCGCWTACRRC